MTKLDENVITNCNEDSDKWYILEVDGEYPNTIFTMMYHFYQKDQTLENLLSLFVINK